MKKKQVTLILHSFTPSDMNFQAILMPKVILAKILSQKITHLENSYLKYALGWDISQGFLLHIPISQGISHRCGVSLTGLTKSLCFSLKQRLKKYLGPDMFFFSLTSEHWVADLL